MKIKGFTLIELMIVICIIGILAAVVFNAAAGSRAGNTVSFGYNGVVEMRCINHLQFVVSNGQVRQVYDQFGHGVECK